jgi:tripartite-type tricarboxylate transporter receptor subunit TctC
MMNYLINFSAAAVAAVVIHGAAYAAEKFPTRPVRLIVPFPPGGSNDIVGRMIAAQLIERLGKQVVVDNRGGAGGVIGSEIAAKSQPDGHTLLVISVSYAYNPALYKLSYDPVKAFTPVAMIGSGPNALVVNPGLPVNSVKELIALAKAKPGQLNNANAGVGSFQHLSSELFRIMAGVNIVQVPFKGGSPAMVAVMGGQAQLSIGTLIQMLPQVRAGRLKVLGIGSAKRVAVLPDVPTITETGLPGYEASNWWGILAPAGTPAAFVKKLHTEISAVLESPETQKWFVTEGAEAVNMSTQEFGKYVSGEMAKWGKVVKEAGIRAE